MIYVNDLAGFCPRKLSQQQARNLHYKARILQSSISPRNSSMNTKNISLNIQEEIIKFQQRKEAIDQQILNERSKLHYPVPKTPQIKAKPKPAYLHRNGFKKFERIRNSPLSKYHNVHSYLTSESSDSSPSTNLLSNYQW